MEEDIDLSLSPLRKSAPKQGRRAGGPTKRSSSRENLLEDANEGNNASMSNLRSRPVSGELFLDEGNKRPPGSGPPLHGRRTGGWADENSR